MTYGSICALAKLLELLERAGVPWVVHDGHDWDDLAFAEVADADRRIGAVWHGKSPRVRGLELAGGWPSREVGVPEDGGGSGELAGNAQGGGGVVGGWCGGGGWLRRFGRV
jgi:hypothetical protein